MKGAGEILFAILAMILLFVILGIFVTYLRANATQQQNIMYEELELTRLKNTFSLVDRSLGMTWYISSIQALFRTGDESIGCGYDDYQYTDIPNAMKDGYWYQYSDPKAFKNQKLVDIKNGQMLGGKYSFKGSLKYPQVCYPQTNDIDNYIGDKFGPFKNIPTDFTENDIQFKISNPDTQFDLTEDKLIATSTQHIVANPEQTTPTIDTTTTNTNNIDTKMIAMTESGRNIVDKAFGFYDSLNDNRYSSPFFYSQGLNKDVYLAVAKKKISDDIAAAIKPGLTYTISMNNPEIRAGNPGEVGFSPEIDKQGLVLHYDASVTISENGIVTTSATGCDVAQDYVQLIGNAYDSYNNWIYVHSEGGGYSGGLQIIVPGTETKMEFSKEEITLMVSAMIKTESTCNFKAVSDCGAAGILQIMPKTAIDLGLKNIYKNTDDNPYLEGCTDSEHNYLIENLQYAARLKAAIQSATDDNQVKTIDDRLDPQKEIPAAMKYIRDRFDYMRQFTKDKTTLMQLVIASYNTGQGNVKNAIDKLPEAQRTDVKYSDISGYLMSVTQDYVNKVVGFYISNGGSMATNGYYYYDENADTFRQKPFSLNLKIEDYLNVLDCVKEQPMQPQVTLDMTWNSGFDLVCCGGALWSCRADNLNNMGNHNLGLNDKIDSTRGAQGQVCANLIDTYTPHDPNEDPNHPQVFRLDCTDSGFRQVDVSQ